MNSSADRLFSRLVLVAALGTASTAASAQATVHNGILANQSGMTLYTFDRDATGRSVCGAACEKLWTPFRAGDPDNASGGSSAPAAMDYITDYSTILRDDGTRQWAYKGKPLYMFAKDQNPGETNGEEFNKSWHVAKP